MLKFSHPSKLAYPYLSLAGVTVTFGTSIFFSSIFTLGSVSLPFSSSSDSMVKVASETVSSPPFYDSFFDLVRRYLATNEVPGATP